MISKLKPYDTRGYSFFTRKSTIGIDDSVFVCLPSDLHVITSNLLDNKIGSEVYICGLFPHIMTMVFLVYFSHAATVSEGLIILYSGYKRLKKGALVAVC